MFLRFLYYDEESDGAVNLVCLTIQLNKRNLTIRMLFVFALPGFVVTDTTKQRLNGAYNNGRAFQHYAALIADQTSVAEHL
jgi:hypothetical protein